MSTSAAATVGSAAVAVVPLIPHPVYEEDDPATQVFVCPLCCDLAVQDPSITHCQHIFCRDCIASALNRQAVCPIDRGSLRMSQVLPISGPLKQIWQSIKVNCPKCNLWSGPLETYESHVKICLRLNEEQIKKLQDEVASTNRVNRMLTNDLATVQEKMKQMLQQKQQLEKELAGVTAEMKNAKAAHQVTVRSLADALVKAKASMITNRLLLLRLLLLCCQQDPGPPDRPLRRCSPRLTLGRTTTAACLISAVTLLFH
jgi:Zinc finger, C3HC4 type (RING finger)